MRALCWHRKGDVRVDTVPDPKIEHPRNAIVKITACAICGSDSICSMVTSLESGDILGHENMGEVIGQAQFPKGCGFGLEGLVSKRRESNHRPGRSPSWIR